MQGIDEVLVAARDFPPEAVADWCGIDADRIRSLARELAGTPRAVVYGRIGLCNQEFGTLASWLVEVVNILTGHFDVEGGARFPRPAIATISSTARRRGPLTTGRWRTRCAGAPEVMGQAPLSCLAEEIATPGEGQIRALITIAGNPVLSAPDAGRLDDALPMLDAMISIDNYLNETSRHAHVILPGPVAARAAALRRGALGLRAARRGPLVAGDLRRRRPTRGVGDRAAPRRHPRRDAGRGGRRRRARRRMLRRPRGPPRRRHRRRHGWAARARPHRRPHLADEPLGRRLRRAPRRA